MADPTTTTVERPQADQTPYEPAGSTPRPAPLKHSSRAGVSDELAMRKAQHDGLSKSVTALINEINKNHPDISAEFGSRGTRSFDQAGEMVESRGKLTAKDVANLQGDALDRFMNKIGSLPETQSNPDFAKSTYHAVSYLQSINDRKGNDPRRDLSVNSYYSAATADAQAALNTLKGKEPASSTSLYSKTRDLPLSSTYAASSDPLSDAAISSAKAAQVDQAPPPKPHPDMNVGKDLETRLSGYKREVFDPKINDAKIKALQAELDDSSKDPVTKAIKSFGELGVGQLGTYFPSTVPLIKENDAKTRQILDALAKKQDETRDAIDKGAKGTDTQQRAAFTKLLDSLKVDAPFDKRLSDIKEAYSKGGSTVDADKALRALVADYDKDLDSEHALLITRRAEIEKSKGEFQTFQAQRPTARNALNSMHAEIESRIKSFKAANAEFNKKHEFINQHDAAVKEYDEQFAKINSSYPADALDRLGELKKAREDAAAQIDANTKEFKIGLKELAKDDKPLRFAIEHAELKDGNLSLPIVDEKFAKFYYSSVRQSYVEGFNKARSMVEGNARRLNSPALNEALSKTRDTDWKKFDADVKAEVKALNQAKRGVNKDAQKLLDEQVRDLKSTAESMKLLYREEEVTQDDGQKVMHTKFEKMLLGYYFRELPRMMKRDHKLTEDTETLNTGTWYQKNLTKGKHGDLRSDFGPGILNKDINLINDEAEFKRVRGDDRRREAELVHDVLKNQIALTTTEGRHRTGFFVNPGEWFHSNASLFGLRKLGESWLIGQAIGKILPRGWLTFSRRINPLGGPVGTPGGSPFDP